MRKGLYVLVLALVAGMATFCVSRCHQQSIQKDVLLDTMPELTWLRDELKLTDAQFAKASELHVAYRPFCKEMCHKVATAHADMDRAAAAAQGMTPELQKVIREHALIHAECREKMLEHLYQTAELFDEKQAARYLETMVPLALGSTESALKGAHHH